MILKRVKGALHSLEFSVGAVATGREARGLTSSESCRDCVHGKFQLCASSASKLQRSLPPTSRFNIFWHQNIRTVALSVSGFCLGSAVVENTVCSSQTFAGVQEAPRAPQWLLCTSTSTNEGSGTALSKLNAKSLPLQFKSHCSQ